MAIEERPRDASPRFEPGDVVAAASRVDQTNPNLRDLHGPGRLFHLDRQLRTKRELETGVDGLLVGVAWHAPSRRILCTDVRARSARWVQESGESSPGPAVLPRRAFGSLDFAPDGSCLLGVHSRLAPTPDDGLGEGKLARADFAVARIEMLDVEIDGGRFGFHCVTHFSLVPRDEVLVYVSEGGRRVMRFDLGTRRQLPDFLRLQDADPRGTYGPIALDGSTILMATGSGIAWFREGGEELRRVDCEPSRGWSRVTALHDGRSFLLGNFLEGILQRRSLADGSLLAERALGVRNCLSGVAEIA